MKCNVLSIWHSSPQVLNREHLVHSDFTPVRYDGGEGLFTIMGYITTETESQCAILLDNAFTITDGNPPKDETHILCDAIKDKINSVASKVIFVLETELRMKKYDHQLEYYLDTVDMAGNLPNQLTEIQLWINKKFIIDQHAAPNDDYDSTLYFSEDSTLSEFTKFITKWDEFYEVNKKVLQYLSEQLDAGITFSEEQEEYIEEMLDEINRSIALLTSFHNKLCEKSNFDHSADVQFTAERYQSPIIDQVADKLRESYHQMDDKIIHEDRKDDAVDAGNTTEGTLGQIRETEGDQT